MKIYIDSAETISTQNTFDSEFFSGEINLPQNGFYKCATPDYSQLISPKLLRRMTDIIKMGVSTSLKALQQAEIENPDAVIIGTGLGCTADTGKFLNQINENKETLLNPTSFIQSTHNTVAGQIAIMLNCKNYNFTFSQKHISFETALLDAFLMLKENENMSILLGAGDEINEEVFYLLNKTRLQTSGFIEEAIPAEGFAAFVISNKKSKKNKAQIKDLCFFETIDENSEEKFISEFLLKNNLNIKDIDLFISGDYSHKNTTEGYNEVKKIFDQSIIAQYKHVTGEYNTVSAFAVKIAVFGIEKNSIPEILKQNAIIKPKIKNTLIHSYSRKYNHSFILIKSCD